MLYNAATAILLDGRILPIGGVAWGWASYAACKAGWFIYKNFLMVLAILTKLIGSIDYTINITFCSTKYFET